MVEDTKELIKELKTLNSNIKILSKIMAITIGKDEIFKDKDTKESKIEVLSKMGLSSSLIAIMIGSTPGSVSAIKSMSKDSKKRKKSVEPK